MGTGVFPNIICTLRNSGFITRPLQRLRCTMKHKKDKNYSLNSLLALFTLSQLQKHESLFHCLKHKLKHMF